MSDLTRCRWGILGAAIIGRKFWQSVRLSENGVLSGVASRKRARAVDFRTECQTRFAIESPPKIFSSYEQMLDSPEIDAVYIPLPTGVREQWVIAAAERGKHVLCEKPCAVSKTSMGAMIDACERAGVQFMDNVMFMHTARLERLKKLLADPEKIGKLKRINSQFSFCADADFFRDNIRNQMAMEPWGCLGDLGWYNIRIILVAMNGQLPVRVRGHNLDGTWDRPASEFSGEMDFADGTSAGLYCSFNNGNQQWAHFSGTKGYAMMDDFALPWFGNQNAIHFNAPTFNRSGYDFNYEKRAEVYPTNEYSNAHSSAQEVNLVRNFSQLVIDGRIDSYWSEIALKTQTVMDTLLLAARERAEVNV